MYGMGQTLLVSKCVPSWKLKLFFVGKVCLEVFKVFWIFLGDKIALGRRVSRFGDSVFFEPAWNQLLCQKVRNDCIPLLSVIVDVQLSSI